MTVQHSRWWNEYVFYIFLWSGRAYGPLADRVALNDDDAKVKKWFISEVEKLGCKVTVRRRGPSCLNHTSC